MSKTPFALGFALLASLPLGAQASSHTASEFEHLPSRMPFFEFDYQQSTGEVFGAETHTEISASLHVEVPNSDSIRLRFSDANLAGGELKITSLRDEATQVLDQRGLEQWSQSSAWFNGGSVVIDLILPPGAGPAIVTIDSLEVGGPPTVSQSQCGPTDDRVPSNDPRVARLLPSGCTAWMIDDCGKCFLSAGHCGTGNNLVEFNVPFSNGNGSWNHPPPSDQYPIDSSSVQSQNNFGADWLYFGTFDNASTGLSAFEAQGDAFALASPPVPAAGNTIRITGHGSDFTPNGTYNQVQQTHTGPYFGASGTLTYQVDTEGGNSGSPVIWEDENVAIGIHTNAGCSTGGGANNGTNINQANLQAALNNPLGVCAAGGFGGAFENLGNSLVAFPFTDPPELSGCGTLEPGSPYKVVQTFPDTFSALATSNSSVLIAGFSQLNLPFEGGLIVPALDIVQVLPIDMAGLSSTVQISSTWSASIPSGTSVYAQFWTPITTLFGSDTIASNALKLTTP